VRAQIAALAGPGQEPPRGHIAFTARAKKGFELALREATMLGQQIGTGHLLLGLTGQADCMAAQVLGALGVDVAVFRARVIAQTASRPEGQEYPPRCDRGSDRGGWPYPTRSRRCSTRSTTG
jgi:ATP-dependent Clp protease ATP-binding subunit ClpC